MAKKKLTKEQKHAREEKIADALHVAGEALKINKLCLYLPYNRGIAGSRPTRRPELMALADAMTDRAADMLLEAFDGHVHGKKIPAARKAPT
jgi:hypothetical protein